MKCASFFLYSWGFLWNGTYTTVPASQFTSIVTIVTNETFIAVALHVGVYSVSFRLHSIQFSSKFVNRNATVSSLYTMVDIYTVAQLFPYCYDFTYSTRPCFIWFSVTPLKCNRAQCRPALTHVCCWESKTAEVIEEAKLDYTKHDSCLHFHKNGIQNL